MNQYISTAGGYLTNPDSLSNCEFCAFRTSDQFLGLQFNIQYSNRWRDVGIFCGFTVFNVSVPLYSYFYNNSSLPSTDLCDLYVHISIPHSEIRFLQIVQAFSQEELIDSTSALVGIFTYTHLYDGLPGRQPA